MNAKSTALLALTSALVFTACSTQPIALQSEYQPPPPQHQSANSRPVRQTHSKAASASAPMTSCSLHLATLEDLRSDRTMLGTVAGRPVLSQGDSDQWIREMLRSGLEHYGIRLTIAPQPANTEPLVTADGKLMTAWVASVTTSMNSNVVVVMSYKDGDVDKESTYRGMKTQMNWASGNGEIHALVNAAFTELLGKLAADVRQRCATRLSVTG